METKNECAICEQECGIFEETGAWRLRGINPPRPVHDKCWEVEDMVTYPGGANRSRRLPRYELIDPTFLAEIAEVMDAGTKTHGECNWRKGQQEYVQAIPRHMVEHLWGIITGDTSENHLAHLACNVMMMAKLRKKYPYQVPGAPKQIELDLDTEKCIHCGDPVTLESPARYYAYMGGDSSLTVSGLVHERCVEEYERVKEARAVNLENCNFCEDVISELHKPHVVNLTDSLGKTYRYHGHCWRSIHAR